MDKTTKHILNMQANCIEMGIAAIERKWSEDPEEFKKRVGEVLKIFQDMANDFRKMAKDESAQS